MTIYSDMLQIKKFRERQAELALVRQRLRRAAADNARREAESQLESFQVAAKAREDKMYSELWGKVVKLRAIEAVQQEISILKSQELTYQQDVEKQVQNLTRENEALAECGVAHQQAARLTAKFIELEDAHSLGVRQALDYSEDLDMEEASAMLHLWSGVGTLEREPV